MLCCEGRMICTKRDNMYRFDKYRSQLKQIRHTYDKRFGVFCSVYHLGEADGARSERAAVGQGEYDPTLDIDRYMVDCAYEDGEVEWCPMLDAIDRAIERKRIEAGRDKLNGSECKRTSLIRGGDGYIGVIAPVHDAEFDFLPDEYALGEICKGCKCRRESADGDADQVKVIRPYVVDYRYHSGIIAFFKRLFRR